MDTVRVPVSLVPNEDLSARYQKQLKTRQHAGTDISESAVGEGRAVKAVTEADAGEDSTSQGSEALASAEASAAEETAASKQTSEDTTASDSPKRD